MMHWFDSLSFRGKLFLNFLISAGVLILAIVFCLTEIQQLSGQAEHVAGTVLPSLQQAGKISELRLRYRVRSLEYMLSTDPAEQTKMEASLTELDGQVSKAVADGTALAQSDAQRQLLDEVSHAVAAYRATVQAAIALRKQDDTAGADHLRQTDWVKLANALRDKTDALVKFSRQESDAATQQERHMSNAALVGGLSALAVGTLVAVLFSLWFSRRMSMRLGEAVSVTRRIAAGDLHSVLPASSQDEVGRLLTAIGEMQTALRDTIVAIRRDAEQLSTTASALTEGSTKIVGNANTQSTAASAIVESVEELTIAISQMAASMKAADRMASDADQRARRGHDDLDRLIHEITHVETAVVNASAQIKTLQTQSGRISAVANTIKGIADQTNLLALNAAIEAARAGETGRGFAVVADEVRKLAERTAQSTVEITEMIAGIQQSTELAVAGINQGVTSVEAGADLARDAGETIAALQACAGQVAQIVKESSAALALQSSASNDVTHRVEEIALHATETSDACTDSVNASTQLRDMAAHMEHAIARFQV